MFQVSLFFAQRETFNPNRRNLKPYRRQRASRQEARNGKMSPTVSRSHDTCSKYLLLVTFITLWLEKNAGRKLL